MNRNLVLSAAVGYNFQQIELFIKSLRRFYSDQICIIVDNKDNDLVETLKKYDCESIITNINRKEIQFKRYEVFHNFIKDKNFDQILLCDSRDIYFQGNPFNFNFKNQINFFLEDYKIKNCPYNSNWILKTYGKKEYELISEKTILCSGTVLGKNEKIKEYLNKISEHIKNFRYKKRLKYYLTFRTDPEGRGCDQGHANYIAHKAKINNIEFHSNSEGPFATAFYLNKIIFDEKFRLINQLGKPYLLVHQYDKRWDKFSDVFKFIKAKFDID